MVDFTNLRPDTAFALARAVLRADDSDPETIAAALAVLEVSTDADDRATVAMLRGHAVEPVRADMGEWDWVDAPALELPSVAPPRWQWAALVAAAILVAALAAAVEWVWIGGAA